MAEFSEIYEEVIQTCAFDSLSDELSERLGRACAPSDVATLIAKLEFLDPANLRDDAGDEGDFYWRLRLSLSDALVAAGEIAVEPLLAALNDGNASAAPAAARSLGLLRSRRALPGLRHRLATARTHVERLPYIAALGDLDERSVVEQLMPYLRRSGERNGGWLVRVTAVALGKIGDASVTGALCSVLESDPDWFARLGAAEGLGLLGNREALPALERALGDTDSRVSQAAQDSMALIGTCPPRPLEAEL